MKTIIVLATLVAVAMAIPADTYDPKYDNFDVNELVNNIRVLKNYGNCFLDLGPCTTEGLDFKKAIPEALKTQCGKCTPKQRDNVRIVVKGFQAKLPEVWQEIVQKHDPNGQYKESFNEFLNANN